MSFLRESTMDMEVCTDCFISPVGKETAEYVRDHLHENLIIAMNNPDLNSTEKQLEYAFYMTDIESKNAGVKNSGSTCVCVVLRNEGDKRVLYSANAGDSRSVLYSSGRTQRLSKVRLVILCE